MLPKVSICIPAYKRVSLLKKALESILEQTFTDYEVIVTDDTPDDSVKELLQEFDFGGKLNYFHNTIQLGSPANWNYGIEKAKGEYIKILHCDDFFTSPESLGEYVKMLDNNPEVDLGFSSAHAIFLVTGEKWIHSCSEKQYKRILREPDYLFFRNMIGNPSATIYRRRVNIPFDINLRWLVDVDFYLKILNNNRVLAHSGEPLISTVHEAEEQISASVKNDKTVQVREHVYVFNNIRNSGRKIRLNKFVRFFELMFHKYKITSMTDLNQIIIVPTGQVSFFSGIIASVNKGMIYTRLYVKLYNSKLNKNIFKRELF